MFAGTILPLRNWFFSPKSIELTICNSSGISLASGWRARFYRVKKRLAWRSRLSEIFAA
jgi:hypothetical protein